MKSYLTKPNVKRISSFRRKAISYSDFMNKVDQNKISEVLVTPGDSQIKYMDVEGFVDTARVFIDDSFFHQLREHTVGIQISNPQPSLNFLTYLIPAILLFSILGNMPRPSQLPGLKKDFELVKDVQTRFSDVAGIEEELNEVKEIVDFLKQPELFKESGAKVPKGCLLSGPPGTGKTLIARSIAGEAGVPFIATSASQFIELFVGLGASRVRNLFKLARENSPCIIFIDELDAIAKSRSPSPIGNNNDEREQTLNQLLTELDGFKENEGIILIGATNRPDVIDPAILRPGRFDRKIQVGLPDKKGREMILKVHAKNKTIEDDVTFETLSSITTGFSGAELQNLMNEAAIYAARNKRKIISKQDIDTAYEKITIGLPKNRVYDDDMKKIVAYHEAGHALMGVICGENVKKITILPRGQTGGFTQFIPKEEMGMIKKSSLENQIKIALGGRAAEEIVFGKPDITTGASGDLQVVTDIIYQMVANLGFSPIGNFIISEQSSDYLKSQVDDEVRKTVKELYKQTIQDLTENRDRLDAIANALIKYDTIDHI